MKIKHSYHTELIDNLKIKAHENLNLPLWIGINRLIERLCVAPVMFDCLKGYLIVDVPIEDFNSANLIVNHNKK